MQKNSHKPSQELNLKIEVAKKTTQNLTRSFYKKENSVGFSFFYTSGFAHKSILQNEGIQSKKLNPILIKVGIYGFNSFLYTKLIYNPWFATDYCFHPCFQYGLEDDNYPLDYNQFLVMLKFYIIENFQQI